MDMSAVLQPGKIPNDVLAVLLQSFTRDDARVCQGPGIGLDCAIIDAGDKYLALKTDPITFATHSIGWYAVQVNANDIACSGATPRWMMCTILLPVGTTVADVDAMYKQISEAASGIGVTVIGGHTEITLNIPRPIISGFMMGEVDKSRLVVPSGCRTNDVIILTKNIPLEFTAIAAYELSDRLGLSDEELSEARSYLNSISVVRDAQIATSCGHVTAMHDPTEGGLLSGIWELAQCSHHDIIVDMVKVDDAITPLSRKICTRLSVNPYACIASGALLISADDADGEIIVSALQSAGISARIIARVASYTTEPTVRSLSNHEVLLKPLRDEVARLFESVCDSV